MEPDASRLQPFPAAGTWNSLSMDAHGMGLGILPYCVFPCPWYSGVAHQHNNITPAQHHETTPRIQLFCVTYPSWRTLGAPSPGLIFPSQPSATAGLFLKPHTLAESPYTKKRSLTVPQPQFPGTASSGAAVSDEGTGSGPRNFDQTTKPWEYQKAVGSRISTARKVPLKFHKKKNRSCAQAHFPFF